MASTSKVQAPAFSRKEIPELPIPKNDRTQSMTKIFKERFNSAPDFFVRVPGRVNIIGEHLDYSGYAVLPMALEQDILLAVKPNADDDFEVKLVNMDSTYADYQFNIRNFEITIVDNKPEWYHYFLSGAKGILAHLMNATAKAFSVVVSGTIPPAAGLASSSALVCAAAIATGKINRKFLELAQTKERFAEICSHSENRYIGTQGGGMEHHIQFLATRDCAKLVELNPIHLTDVIIPDRVRFIIANSRVKTDTNKRLGYYRLYECKLASQVLARKKHSLQWKSFTTLQSVHKEAGCTLEEMIAFVADNLHDEAYPTEEIAIELQTSVGHLETISYIHNSRLGLRDFNYFKLKQRARHVFTEALRVASFVEKCNSHNPSQQPGETTEERDARELRLLEELGELMNQSHESLKNDFENSNETLNSMVTMARQYALGAKISGTGWGGCIVAMVLTEKVGDLLDLLKKNFYHDLPAEEMDSYVFVTIPNDGACVYFK